MSDAISNIKSNQAGDATPVVQPLTPSASAHATHPPAAADSIQLSSSAIAVLAAAQETAKKIT